MTTPSDDIKRSLIHKILIGQYPVGSTLPSCRDLASELGINRNTASKIYQEMAREGLVKTVRGRGVVVISRRPSQVASVASVRERILAAAREAKLLGMERDTFLKTAFEVVDELYQRERPAVAFVECNEQDIEVLARDLEEELSFPVHRVLLSALERSPEAIAADYDIVCTTLYHLRAVTNAMGPAKDKVVAVHAPPDTDALLEIARLHPTARVGIVCAEPTTKQYLATAVAMVHHGQARTCLLSDRQGLRQIEHSVDVLVDVPSCHEEVRRLLPSLPTVTVGFRIDGKSLEPLRDRLAEFLTQHVPSL